MKALTIFRICFVLSLFLSGINGSVAENLFDVVVDDGTSPTKGYIFLDTITNQDRVVQIDRSGNVLWQAEIPHPAKLKKRCRGADIEYNADRDTIRVLIPFDSIIEIDRYGLTKILVEDDGLSHDFDSLRNGNILYTRGWSKKGAPEVIEVDKNGKTVFEWIGSNFISEEDWHENAKIGAWPEKWNKRLEVNSYTGKDWLHVNSVSSLSDDTYLLSVLNLNSILIISNDGRILDWITDASFVHDPVAFDGNILFSQKTPNVDKKDFTESLVFQDSSGERKSLFAGQFRAIRGITAMEDGWFMLTTAGQILEVNLSGQIRLQLKIIQQEVEHEYNQETYKSVSTRCGKSMGTLYKAAPVP